MDPRWNGIFCWWSELLIWWSCVEMLVCVLGTCWTSCLWEIVSISCAGKLLFHCFCILDNICVTSLSVTSDGNVKLLNGSFCKHLIEFYILIKKGLKFQNKSHSLRNKTAPHFAYFATNLPQFALICLPWHKSRPPRRRWRCWFASSDWLTDFMRCGVCCCFCWMLSNCIHH